MKSAAGFNPSERLSKQTASFNKSYLTNRQAEIDSWRTSADSENEGDYKNKGENTDNDK